MEQIHSASGGESIKVFVRVRPPDPNLETSLQQGVCLEVTSETTLTVNSKPDPKVFTFDHVAKETITQEDVFSAVGRPTIDSCMHGYNGTIFAYGQTGSGKTFTMIGPPSEDSEDTFTHELRGIIPRSFEYLFSLINRNKQKYGGLVEFLCKCSFLEIYNEQVFDLLDPASCGLHLRENMKHGVYVDGLTETSVASAKEAYQVLSTGWVNRKVASTSMNRESSRSHAVFTLTVESKKRETKDAVAKIRTSLLNLVDLAGSERQRDTHAAGLRLKEAGSINKSLSALGNVIMALVDIANGKTRHVHYRDSKLTFLLRDSLGGNAKTNLVANVHPSARCFGESLSTLNFARRAKMIRNKAVVNEDTSGNVGQLQAEIKRLKVTIEKLRTQSESGVVQVLSPSPPSPPLVETRSHDEKAYRELKTMLTASMEARDATDKEKNELLDKVSALEELCNKKDKFLQSTKMILKFREAHISNLEKNRRTLATPNDPTPSSDAPPTTTSSTSNTSSMETATIGLLRQEIAQLKYLVDHHPDGNRLTRENLNLKAELKQLRASHSSKGAGQQASTRQLEQSHRYTLQLERQLRHYLAKGNNPSSLAPAPTTPTKLTFDLESLQLRCKQLQEELDRTRRNWSSDREESRLRESKLEANLSAARKANIELERSLEALKLRNSVERETLNDIHMNTIKTILTPRRDRDQMRTRSMSLTPSSHIRRADSDPPLRHQLSLRTNSPTKLANSATSPTAATFPAIPESPLQDDASSSSNNNEATTPPLSGGSSSSSITSTPQAKKPRLSKTPALDKNPSEDTNEVPESGGIVKNGVSPLLSPLLGESLNEEGDLEGDLDGLNIQGALTDELKVLHGRNRGLRQQLEGLERRVVHLTQSKGALEAQVQEITQLSRLEREGYYDKEQEYLEKIAGLASQIADIKSSNEVLSSEVQDLRVCLKSADKELKERKEEQADDRRRHEAKVTSQLHKIGELEQLWSAEESKYNRAVEELQNLQDEVETVREELTFKDHRLLEMEGVLRKEKEAERALEEEVQGLMDKLALEVERSSRLSQELKEGQNGTQEFVSLVNENSRLRGEMERLEQDLQTRLHTHKQQLEGAESSINTLLQRQSTDEAAIAKLVSTVQELRGEKVQSSAKVSALQKDLEESGRELTAAETKLEELRGEVAGLRAKVSEAAAAHKRELEKREAEREVVLDDLEGINDQYQQLNHAFQTQARELASAKAELEEKSRELEASENELNRILQDKMERRASMAKGESQEEGAEEWIDPSLLEANSEEEIEHKLKRKLDQAAEMIEGYEKSVGDKNVELQSVKDELLSLEKLREEHDSQHLILCDLRQQLEASEEHKTSLSSRLEGASAQLEQLQQERVVLVRQRERAETEGSEFRSRWEKQEELVAALREQIDRYKTSEESLFQEKESVRSQLEMLNEEKAKLSKEVEKLARENAAITGHQNIRQRIQYHATVKVENAKLKEEVIQLQSRLKRKAEQVDKLRSILTEKGLETKNSSKKQLPQSPDDNIHQTTLKENNFLTS